ncbi:MAG TPA: type II toxin-antitoxin system Phd/YefM family antitoxin [Rhizomicrobium sp.]|nr:type II toxin-antitoxin system Phd/YefM family antitoxin [Rhizomicrobium sp.]
MTSSIKPRAPGRWRLQDAKARLSELVREARERGPQHVSVRGKDEVVIISAEEFRRLSGNLTGRALVEACRASPHRNLEIAPARHRLPVRDVDL